MAYKRRSKAELEKLKGHAKLLFVNDKLSQKEISQRLDITEAVVSRWANDGGWEKLKKNFVLTRQEQMANLLDELTELNAAIKLKPEGMRFADSKQGDIRRKLIRDIKDLETKTNKPEAISACIALLDFIRKVNLPKAQELAVFVDGFIKSIL